MNASGKPSTEAVTAELSPTCSGFTSGRRGSKKRARAHGFPLDAVSDQAGGRPATDDRDTESNEAGDEAVSMDSQQDHAASTGRRGEDSAVRDSDTRMGCGERSAAAPVGDIEGVRSELQQAITALETVADGLREQ